MHMSICKRHSYHIGTTFLQVLDFDALWNGKREIHF